MSHPRHLAAIIIAKNEARHIAGCIASLSWAEQVIVCDNFSSDATAALAQQAGARVVLRFPHENFAQAHNLALDTATDAEWVLFVDADERATPELAAEIRPIVTGDPAPAGYWVPRHNYIFGKLTLNAGYYPDYQMRLLRRGHARYERPVHEVVVLDGLEGRLKHPLIHYNDTLGQFRAKQLARPVTPRRLGTGHRLPHNVILQPLRHFWWRYGTRGYRWAVGLRHAFCWRITGALTYLQLCKIQHHSASRPFDSWTVQLTWTLQPVHPFSLTRVSSLYRERRAARS
jgi:glycosyltransferase involved in cell wall biosynthesis